MKRTTKIAMAVAGALLVALLAGGAALASAHGHDGFVQRRVSRHIDAALDAVAATAAQRDAVHAARDHVFATFAESERGRQTDLQEALALWESDTLDPTGLAALRARHQAAMKKSSDAVVQALSDAHDALTAPQRRQLADYLRANKAAHAGKLDKGAQSFAHHMMSERVDDLLAQIHASAAQRDRVHAAAERAFTAVSDGMGDHGADFDQALTLFTADRLDGAALATMQAAREARMQKLGDAVVQALGEVHDTLDAGQRKQVADYVRSHHHGHAQGHGG